MHVRNVELLEIVVAIERPVSADQIIARSLLIPTELVERHPRNAVTYRGDPVAERCRRIERREEQRSPLLERKLWKTIFGRRKVFRIVELGHRDERAVERESPSVIAASERLEMSFAL